MKGKKIVSFVLTLIMIMTYIPMQVYADPNEDQPSTGDPVIIETGYTLTLNPNYSGEPIGMVMNVTEYTLPEYTRPGYIHKNWCTKSSISEEGAITYNIDEKIQLTGDLTLYAIWEKMAASDLIDGIPAYNGAYVYLGDVKWYIIGENSDKWLLISSEVLGGSKNWQGAKDFCSDVYNAFSSNEKNLVASTGKTDEAYGEYASADLTGEKMFLLSASEAVAYFGSGYSRMPGGWWLRSLCAEKADLAGVVLSEGFLDRNIVYVDDTYGARPAFVLNRSSVLFTSDAKDGKSSAPAGSGEFGEFNASSGDRKLTILGSTKQKKFTASAENTTVTSGGCLSVIYDKAMTGDGYYVSAMLCKSNGDIIGYASITPDSTGAGTWEMTLPDLEAGSYVLKVFSEQQNGNYKTDYASPMSTINLTVQEVYTVTLSAGDGTGDDIVYSSGDGNIADDWNSASNCQFYRCGDNMGFNLRDGYCPDSFTAPEGYVFNGWEGSVQYNDNISQATTFTAKWREDQTAALGPIDSIPRISNGEDFYLNGIKWHVIGADSDKWLAISSELLSDSDSLTMTWSDAMNYCITVYGNFSDVEKAALLKISKNDEKYVYDGHEYDGDAYASSLDDASIFLLSMPEANWYLANNDARICYNSQGAGWWLRSRLFNEYSTAGVVDILGAFYSFGFDYDDEAGCRPAFVLDRSSILFTSASAGGKSSAAAGSGFGSFLDGGNGAKKLTLLASNRNGFTANVDGGTSATVASGGVFEISYNGAGNGSGEYVSAMLCNSSGDVIGYASITPDSTGTGTWEMTLPDLEAGSYVLKVFSEQQNGDYKTDYASPMSTINLTVTQQSPKNTVTGTNVALGDELGLNFYLAIPDETVASGAKVVMNGPKGEQEVLLSEAPKDEDEYKLTYRVNAIQADSDITLKIVDSDNVTLDLYNAAGSKYENGIMTYSVNRYLIDAMNYDGITNKAPIRATYTYCAYACKWKYGTALPTDGYINDLSNPSADALDAFKVVKTNSSNSIKITGYSLVLDSKTAIRVYFTATDAIQDHVIKVGDKILTPVLSGNTVDNRYEYYVEITNIGAGDLETQYTVVFDPASDNYQVKISAMSYVRNVLRQKDKYPDICTEELCDLVTAIYDYAEIFK